MSYEYLMNTATVLYVVCYIPELYANYKNKNANIYNIPEKVVIFIGTSFAFAYALVLDDNALIINYGPILALDVTALLMRVYYAYINWNIPAVAPAVAPPVAPGV
jgi:uncharacterized protein with PQ loop repeat